MKPIIPFAFAAPPAVGGGGGGTMPTLSQTLRAHFRPDLGLTESGGLVSAWLDQSGAGDANRDQSASGGTKPTYSAADAGYGSKPVVAASGSKFMTAGGAWTWSPNASLSILIVGQAAASSSFAGDAGNTSMIYANGSGNLSVYQVGVGARNGSTSVATPKAILITDDTTDLKLYVTDFTTPVDTFGTTFSGLSRLELLQDFSSGGYGHLNGKLAEFAVWSGVLDSTDRNDLKAYLNTTRAYGLGVTT